jgi:transposase
LRLSARERLRVEWMIFYYTQAKQNASLTARHFDISRKTFYKWLNRFKDSLERIESLKDQPRAACRKKNWEVATTQESRIKKLRKKYIHYSKKKLKVLYEKEYKEDISCWKIERVIRKHKIYPDKIRAERIARKQVRARQKPKRRITQLRKEPRLWFLLQLDTIVIYWDNLKRYILTAVDHGSKLGYARMY